jgi:hypothetical protein
MGDAVRFPDRIVVDRVMATRVDEPSPRSIMPFELHFTAFSYR